VICPANPFCRARQFSRFENVQFLTWLEAYGFARSDGNFGAGAWISANSGLAGAHAEDAEAAQLDAVAFGQRLLQTFEYGIDCCFGFVPRQARSFYNVMDNVLFNQCVYPGRKDVTCTKSSL
jgi:hypothetical protein